jgi:hypothetical protein
MPSIDDSHETAAALLAIDTTLAGEPVDPEFAELAELALILRDDRPAAEPRFAAEMDQRVARRFAGPPSRAAATAARQRPWRRWMLAPGAAVGGLAAAALVVVALNGGGGSTAYHSRAGVSSTSSSSATAAPLASPVRAPSREKSAPLVQDLAPIHAAATATTPSASASGSAGAAGASAGSIAAFGTNSTAAQSDAEAPAPQNTAGRDVVQSAQLTLLARPRQISDVAQHVFQVVGSEQGIVDNSTVTDTGTASGYAGFQLSVPSANLQQTMTALSDLPGARVLSRTDATNDITGAVGGAGIRLAEARALRRALLKQLAAAFTTAQIDSLQARIHDADASIASDLAKLDGLKNQVSYSKISLTIQASATSTVFYTPPSSGGFTVGRAAHDALRVLVVAAGVALIVLAALIPVALLGGLAAWIGLALRHRRREHALDMA